MGAPFIVLTIIVLVACSLIFLTYIFIEKPIQNQEVLYNNINIKIIDKNENILVENYTISIDGIEFKKGKSVDKGYILEKLPLNKSFTIFIEGEDIYNEERFIEVKPSIIPININVIIDVNKLGNLTISQNETLENDELINLTIFSEGAVNNLFACLYWTKNIISVDIMNTNITKLDNSEIPQRYKMIKCYNLNLNLYNSTQIISLKYKKYLEFNNDFIKVVFIDGDYSANKTLQIGNKEDIKMKDAEYIIKGGQ